eukprot:m.15163 g.15163  ORF g.15163 m.15163 type:complete len:264 (-) comp3003_c0_seq2:763-1554(-)
MDSTALEVIFTAAAALIVLALRWWTQHVSIQAAAASARTQDSASTLGWQTISDLDCLPNEAAESISSIALVLDSSHVELTVLKRFPRLQRLALSSPFPLPKSALALLAGIPALTAIDLRKCRTVVDANNMIPSLCDALDIYNWAGSLSTLRELLLPPVCAIRVGSIAKCFPRVNVAVVAVTRPVRLGDVIQLRRVAHDLTGGGAHEWRSEQSIVDSMRTDDHRQMVVAEPHPDGPPIDSQYAISLRDVGRKGDAVYWLGVCRT